jgi:hypothetical protein
LLKLNVTPACLAHQNVFVQVLVTDPKELEAIRQRESDITKERIQKILDAGGLCGCHVMSCQVILICYMSSWNRSSLYFDESDITKECSQSILDAGGLWACYSALMLCRSSGALVLGCYG